MGGKSKSSSASKQATSNLQGIAAPTLVGSGMMGTSGIAAQAGDDLRISSIVNIKQEDIKAVTPVLMRAFKSVDVNAARSLANSERLALKTIEAVQKANDESMKLAYDVAVATTQEASETTTAALAMVERNGRSENYLLSEKTVQYAGLAIAAWLVIKAVK
jgi:hypothetical protein